MQTTNPKNITADKDVFNEFCTFVADYTHENCFVPLIHTSEIVELIIGLVFDSEKLPKNQVLDFTHTLAKTVLRNCNTIEKKLKFLLDLQNSETQSNAYIKIQKGLAGNGQQKEVCK